MVAGAVLFLTAGVGMPIGYSGVLLPQLYEINSTLHIEEDIGSWIASIHSLASPFGSLISGPLLDAIGRRSCLQLSAIPLCIGWLLIGFATNLWLMLLGRFFAGFGVGICGVAAQVLVGETADPGIRGFLVSISIAAYCAGILLVYILGSAFTWEIVAFSCIILPAMSLLTLSLISESPVWLIRRGKINAAKKALTWLRGGDMKQITAEMSVLITRTKQEDMRILPSSMSFWERLSETKSKIIHPGVIKPLIIINVFLFLQALSGTYIIVYYGVDLIQDIGKGSVDKYMAAVVTATIRFIFCLLSCVLLLKIGSRTIAIVSGTGTALSSLVLATFVLMRIEESYFDKYIIGVCLFMYVSLNTIGLFTLIGTIISELLPHRARGIGGGFSMFIFNFSLFITAKIFPLLKNLVGMGGVFIIFGISASVLTIFMWLTFPDTRNRSLQEIEDYFNGENILWIKKKKCQNERLKNSEA
ncbi:facilitated trehalose transporter Tret1-2 homolog [Microplitis demolitor]|uniref:facilitated trehalose transporter Tret1-2 homolog n=1 Tax=Microplitis demolitor TaxID=69319 RepID=UPI00235B5EFD|nr:facilitated trehalose transporter Tret1-2 homolog [Microplitis demolitor]